MYCTNIPGYISIAPSLNLFFKSFFRGSCPFYLRVSRCILDLCKPFCSLGSHCVYSGSGSVYPGSKSVLPSPVDCKSFVASDYRFDSNLSSICCVFEKLIPLGDRWPLYLRRVFPMTRSRLILVITFLSVVLVVVVIVFISISLMLITAKFLSNRGVQSS